MENERKREHKHHYNLNTSISKQNSAMEVSCHRGDMNRTDVKSDENASG